MTHIETNQHKNSKIKTQQHKPIQTGSKDVNIKSTIGKTVRNTLVFNSFQKTSNISILNSKQKPIGKQCNICKTYLAEHGSSYSPASSQAQSVTCRHSLIQNEVLLC